MARIIALILSLLIAAGVAASLMEPPQASARPSVKKINLSVVRVLSWGNAYKTCRIVASWQPKIRNTPLGRCRTKTVKVASCRYRLPWLKQAKCWAIFQVGVTPLGYYLECWQSQWWRKFAALPLPSLVDVRTSCRKVPTGQGPPT